MKWSGWQVRLGIILVLCSAAIYTVKFIILGDPENTYFYIFNAIGFLPVNVLLVTLVLNELLSMRSKKERLEKINMVIGTFFLKPERICSCSYPTATLTLNGSNHSSS
jgi:hypothetical protein